MPLFHITEDGHRKELIRDPKGVNRAQAVSAKTSRRSLTYQERNCIKEGYGLGKKDMHHSNLFICFMWKESF